MEFEWYSHKARMNLDKHGVSFADAVFVLYDELALTIKDDGSLAVTVIHPIYGGQNSGFLQKRHHIWRV